MQRKRSSRSGRVKTLAWYDDPEIRSRLRLVETVYAQPLTRALDIVNRQLEANGRAAISYEQLKTDRDHVRALFNEQTPGGLQDHVAALLMLQASVWRSIAVTPDGAQRAQLYAVALRCQEDMAKLDGSWGAVREPVGEFSEVDNGLSPQELLEAGQISREEYRAYLLVMHRQTSVGSNEPMEELVRSAMAGHVKGASWTLPEHPAVAAESDSAALRRPPGASVPFPPPPPGTPRLGEDQLIVDWEGEE